MRNKQLVSIIVPVYNVEKYICRCIDSIVSQTYKMLEIILVDDGSLDSSGTICDEYKVKDERILVIHQNNAGVSAARNRGLQSATGDYVVFVDSDDSVSPKYIANLMHSADADYVATGFLVQTPALQWDEWENRNIETTVAEIKHNPELIKYIPTGSVCSHRYKRGLIKNNHLCFREDISRGEDTLFNSEYLALSNSVKVMDHIDYYCFHREGSATTKFQPQLFGWSVQSVEAIGKIIGNQNDVFYSRAWNNAMSICDNYFSTAQNTSWQTRISMISAVFEVCAHPYTRNSIRYAKETEHRKKAFLVQFYLYPFLPFLYFAYSKIRNLFKKG